MDIPGAATAERVRVGVGVGVLSGVPGGVPIGGRGTLSLVRGGVTAPGVAPGPGAAAGAATGARAGAGPGAGAGQVSEGWLAHTLVQFPAAMAFSVVVSTSVQLLQTARDVAARLTVTH